MSCDCAGPSETPPGSTSGVNSIVGASAFGGRVRVPRNPCGPPTCPQPPTSSAPSVTPYCPGWTTKLTPEETGKLLVVLNDCLFVLKSRCSGMVYFDANTEKVRVIDPPYTSAIPQEARYGFLAKVVPTIHKVCVDGSDECVDEIRQELAAQRLETVSCGELVIANPPLCGDVPPAESGNLANQTRFDYLDPILHEDAGCPKPVRLLVQYPGKRGSAQAQVDCKQWALMRGLTMRGSDLGMLLKTDAKFATALPAVFEIVPTEDPKDPCFTLRIAEAPPLGLPENPENCQTIVFRGKTTTEKGEWKAEDKGFTFHPLAAPVVVGTWSGSGTHIVAMPQFPASPCGDVWAQFEIPIGWVGTTVLGSQITVQIGAHFLAQGGAVTGIGGCQAMAPVSANTTFTVIATINFSATATVKVTGYWY